MATTTMLCRKRSCDSDSPIESKRPKATYYIRLESESPVDSEEDTESVYSIQEKETDTVKDTTDTDSKSDFEVEIEYEVASLSDSDNDAFFCNSSSESEDMILAAAAICDSSLETFITDAEDSDNSRQDDSSMGLTDFWTCIQCKSQNDNPQFRFCDKCYQDRKTFFPPRPRRYRKAKRERKAEPPVKLDALKSCLSGLSQETMSSQDSGIGSSQEFPSLCFDQIVVPKHLNPEAVPSTSSQEGNVAGKSRKRQISESSLSEYEEKRPRKVPKPSSKESASTSSGSKKEEGAVANSEEIVKCADKARTENDDDFTLPECKELCIMCNISPKNSIFLHGRIAHMCCCYRCAMRTWKSLKRCPICNRKVNNVVRVYTT